MNSSINPHFTFNYSQPEEYRFSHDSVFLSRSAHDRHVANGFKPNVILDLCSGSGVVGLDYLFHQAKEAKNVPQRIDFVEIQMVYKTHFQKNVATVNQLISHAPKLEFINCNYQDLQSYAQFKENYDLILCNPPYFRIGQGNLSSSEFKNRCRFFLDSDFKELIRAIDYCLKPKGEALVLIKDLSHHGISVKAELAEFSKGLQAQLLGQVRSTDLYCLTRT